MSYDPAANSKGSWGDAVAALRSQHVDAQTEREKYQDVWKDPRYRVASHGLDLWHHHRTCFPADFETVIDLGCGHGRFFSYMRDIGKFAYGVDVAGAEILDSDIRERHGLFFIDAPLWAIPWPTVNGALFDLGVCTDVMEHVPEDHVGSVIGSIHRHCRRVVYKIANHESHWHGQDLHLTRKPMAWWAERLTRGGGWVNLYEGTGWRNTFVLCWESEQ